MLDVLLQFWKDENGATAIEYASIALIVGVGIISSLQLIPPALNAIFGNVQANLSPN